MKPGKDEKIILASGSPRRRAMMEFFGVPFEVIPSELSEFFAEGEGQWRALDMARKKAFMLSRKQQGRYILAADTMVQVGKNYLGEPKDREDAGRIEKPLKEVKKLKDGKNPAKLKDACDRLEEMLNYADKADGAYDTKFTK